VLAFATRPALDRRLAARLTSAVAPTGRATVATGAPAQRCSITTTAQVPGSSAW
jgi:hypothetical protein